MLKKIFACGAALIVGIPLALAEGPTPVSPIVGIGGPYDADAVVSPEDGFCTGTFIGPSLVLTAGHCLEEGVETLILEDGTIVSTKTLIDDDLNDYGLVEVVNYKAEIWKPLKCDAVLHLGDNIVIMGYPLSFGKYTSFGQITAFDPPASDVKALWPTHSFTVSAIGAGGMSGSAVLNATGEVIGVYVGGYNSGGFGSPGIAVPIDAACSALGNYGT